MIPRLPPTGARRHIAGFELQVVAVLAEIEPTRIVMRMSGSRARLDTLTRINSQGVTLT
jgi:hypothetical protein